MKLEAAVRADYRVDGHAQGMGFLSEDTLVWTGETDLLGLTQPIEEVQERSLTAAHRAGVIDRENLHEMRLSSSSSTRRLAASQLIFRARMAPA